jgi:adenylosuccinate synthase
MSSVIILGLQWGDEGKGKIVDLACPAFDAVVRFQGGHNAGHTVKFADQHFALHLIPSGILHPDMQCVLGNGMVISPAALLEEMDSLEGLGVRTEGRLFVSDRAQLILPVHLELDSSREEALGDRKIGTTSRGIGPTYETKMSREGLRMTDLLAEDFPDRVRRRLARVASQLADPERLFEETLDSWPEWRYVLKSMVTDTSTLLNNWLDDGRRLLFEGAQGALLDVDHGTYPFVTSSNSTAGGACTGSGVAPTRIDGVIGVLKAYTTRVGEGPFPGELEDEVGEQIRQRGNEFGTTTGRPRRCGWLDLVAARQAVRLNGVEAIALTKLDVLDSLSEIPVCTGYRLDGSAIDQVPADTARISRIEPVYETLAGWEEKTVGVESYDGLPSNARRYVDFIESFVGAAVSIVSTGPRREETILREHRLLAGVAVLS